MSFRKNPLIGLAAFTLLISAPVFAEVTVTSTEALVSTDWAKDFGGGSLTVFSSITDGIDRSISAGSGFIQTFKGDGKKLEGVGVYFKKTAAPVAGKKFTIALIDYGDAGPVKDNADQLNAVQATVFSEPFTLETQEGGRQCYFKFSGAANVTLKKTHYYGIVLQFADASDEQAIFRSLNDAFPDGRLALGTPGAFVLDFAGGDRDSLFAIYTAAP